MAMFQKYIHNTCFTSWVTSNANPCPMTTTQDSLYFLSIVSFTNRAALCNAAQTRSGYANCVRDRLHHAASQLKRANERIGGFAAAGEGVADEAEGTS